MTTSIVNTTPLSVTFERARSTYQQLASIMRNNWAPLLSGSCNATEGLGAANVIANQVLPVFSAAIAAPGMDAYAQLVYGDSTVTFVAWLQTMSTALTNILNALNSMAAQAQFVASNGNLTGATFTEEQTAPVLSLVNTAIAALV